MGVGQLRTCLRVCREFGGGPACEVQLQFAQRTLFHVFGEIAQRLYRELVVAFASLPFDQFAGKPQGETLAASVDLGKYPVDFFF